jgi:hypothetical protein
MLPNKSLQPTAATLLPAVSLSNRFLASVRRLRQESKNKKVNSKNTISPRDDF